MVEKDIRYEFQYNGSDGIPDVDLTYYVENDADFEKLLQMFIGFAKALTYTQETIDKYIQIPEYED